MEVQNGGAEWRCRGAGAGTGAEEVQVQLQRCQCRVAGATSENGIRLLGKFTVSHSFEFF